MDPLKSPASLPDLEVPPKARRRRFTGEYKRRIVEQADAAQEPGSVGALLRREGLYSSHLAVWRQQYREGALAGSKSKKRGRKASAATKAERKAKALERENARLRRQLEQAKTVIDVQKKVSELMGIPLETDDDTESN